VKTLEIIEEESKIIRLIFDSYANKGMSMGEIATMMNEMKVKKRTESPWTRGTIAEIIMNPVYMGKIRWNYRMIERSWENQQMAVSYPRRSIDECMLVEGKHPAIITEELFYKAIERKSQNVPIKKDNELKNPFAGIFFCAKCGKAMKLRTGDSKNPPRLECSQMKFCGNASATYEEVMDTLCDGLLAHIKDFEVRIDNDNSNEIEAHKMKIDAMEKRLVEIEKKELSLWDKYAEDGMPKHIFDKLMESVTTDKKELKESIEKARENTPRKEEYTEKVRTFKMALDILRDDSVSAKIKNTYLRSIIGRMTFEREKGVILTKELAEELGVPYTHPLCRHNYTFHLDITLRD
jgi:hypothetical protein